MTIVVTLFYSFIAHAGEGALSVQIRAAGQEVKHSIQDLANGQFDILFYPTMAIPHKFDVKYNGLPITSSPVEAKVRKMNLILLPSQRFSKQKTNKLSYFQSRYAIHYLARKLRQVERDYITRE